MVELANHGVVVASWVADSLLTNNGRWTVPGSVDTA
jgi:hypothetical protein